MRTITVPAGLDEPVFIKLLEQCLIHSECHLRMQVCVYIYICFFFFLPLEVKKVKVLVAQRCLTLCDSQTGTRQAPLSMGFYRKEYWTGLPFPSPGDLPDPGVKPRSPALQVDSLLSEPPGKPSFTDVIT